MRSTRVTSSRRPGAHGGGRSPQAATSIKASAAFGLLYGAFWWVLGGLFLMPVWLGMNAFTFNGMAWTGLYGHLIYGFTLGVVYGFAARLMSSRRA